MSPDYPLVLDLIMRDAFCTDCIARKTNVDPERVDTILAELRRHFVTRTVGECAGCRRQTSAHRLSS